MPAYFDQGFMVREPAWHGLGTVFDDYPGREEAMKAAGHDFQIIEAPLNAVLTPDQIGADETIRIPVNDWKALFRDDSRELMGVVRDSYQVVQNDTLWDLTDAIVGQENVKYETAGVLKGGSTLWVLARLDEPATVPGDNSPIYPYALLSTTHDGTGACRAAAVSIRVVCWNTYSAADDQSQKSGRHYTFRHTKKVMDRVDEARQALLGVRADHNSFMELSRELAKVEVDDAGVKEFLARFIPDPPADIATDRVRRNITKARQSVREILEGQTTAEAHRRTGYGLFQAGIEYLDHFRGAHNQETYFKRSVMKQEKLKTHLVQLIRDCAA